jgi:hypothetical protein
VVLIRAEGGEFTRKVVDEEEGREKATYIFNYEILPLCRDLYMKTVYVLIFFCC